MKYWVLALVVAVIVIAVCYVAGVFDDFCPKHPGLCFWQSAEEQRDQHRALVYAQYDD